MLAVSPNSAPNHIGQYQLLSRLGVGGMGMVFKAQHTRLNKTVALKILSPFRTEHPNAIDRFYWEMKALGQLDHPHIAKAYDGGEANGYFFLAMEYVEGVDLGKVLRDCQRLPLGDACEAARQTAEALEYIWDRRLIHRDIKPSNLLLGTDGLIRVLDLGIARLADPEDDSHLTETGAVMGSADFLAPEQAEGSRDIDIRADIYSLGCTLYALLAGSPPFAGVAPLAKFRRISISCLRSFGV